MQILVNKRNEIISYAIIGGFEEGIDIENLPENFSQVFRPKAFKYSNGEIVFNEDYSEEKDDLHQQIDSEEQNTVASDDILRKMLLVCRNKLFKVQSYRCKLISKMH